MPSTVIDSFAYNERKAKLTVRFLSGNSNVPKRVYDEFRKAGSKGKFFNTEIRDAYPAIRLK